MQIRVDEALAELRRLAADASEQVERFRLSGNDEAVSNFQGRQYAYEKAIALIESKSEAA